MNRNQKVLSFLSQEIDLIKNKKDKEFSLSAFEGHKNRYLSDLDFISKYSKKNYKILDIGSSPYHLVFCLKKLGFNITGLDINPNVLKAFQKKHSLIIKKSDIEKDKLPFKNKEFDLIVFNEVFEHLRLNPLEVIKEIKRVLKNNGILMLTTPNLYALHKIIMFNLGLGFNNPYREFKKVEETGYMGHIREYSNREIKEILEKNGFKVIETDFRQYQKFTEFPELQNPIKKIGASLIDFLLTLNKSWKPFQIVISKNT